MFARVAKSVRVLLITACAVGSLLAVAVGVRSYRVGSFISIAHNTLDGNELILRDRWLSAGGGRIVLTLRRLRLVLTPTVGLEWFSPLGVHARFCEMRPDQLRDLRWDETPWRRWGFAARTIRRPKLGPTQSTDLDLAAPFWAIALPLAVPPAIVLSRRRRRQARLRRGLCSACAYDLRETPARCPECGAEQAAYRPPSPARQRLTLAAAAITVIAVAAYAMSGHPPQPAPSPSPPTAPPVRPPPPAFDPLEPTSTTRPA